MAAYTPAVPPIAAILLAVVGAAWGFAADRIAARWPAHEDGSIRGIDWRTVVVVLSGAAALGAVTLRFGDAGVVPAAAFLAWAVALVLLLATDLDQRLLPNELTLPMIPAALALTLAGQNPLLAPGDLPIALLVAIIRLHPAGSRLSPFSSFFAGAMGGLLLWMKIIGPLCFS